MSELPATCNKAEAIRKKYHLENFQVYENDDNDYTFREESDGKGDEYICFDVSELDWVVIGDCGYYIYRIKN